MPDGGEGELSKAGEHQGGIKGQDQHSHRGQMLQRVAPAAHGLQQGLQLLPAAAVNLLDTTSDSASSIADGGYNSHCRLIVCHRLPVHVLQAALWLQYYRYRHFACR